MILIQIQIDGLRLKAELNDSSSARAFYAALPLSIEMSRWGEEYYGDCGLDLPEADDSRIMMEVGELACWPAGRGFCIFFGPTPVSVDETPRAASSVNPIGHIMGDCSGLRNLGSRITAQVSVL